MTLSTYLYIILSYSTTISYAASSNIAVHNFPLPLPLCQFTIAMTALHRFSSNRSHALQELIVRFSFTNLLLGSLPNDINAIRRAK